MRTPPAILLFCRLACLILLMFRADFIAAQVYGCKDPAALNYNSAATVNDGSCQYAVTHYTPPIRPGGLSPALHETSGLQWAGNHLWSFNDSGHDPVLFRIDTGSNAVLQVVILGGAANVDWEDIAFDGTFFYIGDFGNNADGARTNLKIYKFPLSAIPDYLAQPSVTIPAAQIEVINFRYSDQPQPTVPTGANNTRFDCEAMIVDEGKIHLFTKNWTANSTTHYAINSTTAGTYVASPLETLATGYLVTAADKAPGTNLVILLGYQTTGWGLHFLHVLSDYSGGFYFNGNKRRIDLPNAGYMGQAEGIAFRTGTYGYISNEKFTATMGGFTLNVDQRLYSFNTNHFLAAAVLPLLLEKFEAKTDGSTRRLEWRFSEPVKNLNVQYSRDRTRFETIQSYSSSQLGTFAHRPAAGTACYRLAWQGSDGREQYSKLVCKTSTEENDLSFLLLQPNGQLHVRLNASQPARFDFRLLTTDGRTVAKSVEQILLPGYNSIRIGQHFSSQSLLLLQAVGSTAVGSWLLRVE